MANSVTRYTASTT